MQHGAGSSRQRRATSLAVALTRRVGHAARRVGADVRSPLAVSGGVRLKQIAAIHAGNGTGQQLRLTSGAFGWRRRRWGWLLDGGRSRRRGRGGAYCRPHSRSRRDRWCWWWWWRGLGGSRCRPAARGNGLAGRGGGTDSERLLTGRAAKLFAGRVVG